MRIPVPYWSFALVVLSAVVWPNIQAQSQLWLSFVPDEVSTSAICSAGYGANTDFYGFGIRLGFYFQWLSSWLLNTFSPKDANANHDTNSILVLATAIAIAAAFASESIKPVEAYIMIMICFGFYFTVLSSLGIRIFFLDPEKLALFLGEVKETLEPWLTNGTKWKDLRHRFQGLMNNSASWRRLDGLKEITKLMTITFSFNAASFVKHPSLSWAGVMWRAAIASLVAVLNIWLWFSPWMTQHETRDDGSLCIPSVYFFGQQALSGTISIFFKVSAVILAIPAFFLFLLFMKVAESLLTFTYDFLLRRTTISLVERGTAIPWDKLPERTKRMIGLAVSSATGLNGGAGWAAIGMLDVLFPPKSASATGWWTVNKVDLPSMGDLAAAHIALWSRADGADDSSDSGSSISGDSQAQAKSRFDPNLTTRRLCA
jgi:hypothetical protein